MNIKQKLTTLLLLAVGAVTQLNAQVAVTVGSQVTDASSIVSGKAYLLQHQGNGTSTPWLEDAGTFYNCPNSAGNCNLAAVWYLIDNGDGTWKIENAYTGKYWPKPTGNANLVGTDAASAGSWALNFSDGVAAPTCNGYRLNRNTPNLVGWNSGSGSVTQVKIYEVTASALSTTATYSAFTDKDISASATEAASISEGQWYVMKNRGRNGYAFENSGSMKNQAAAPSGSATDNAKFLVRFMNAGSGKYYLQNGLGNYWGAVPDNTAVPATALGTEKYTIGKINSTDGHFYLTSETNGIVLDCQENGYPVVGWGTSIPTSTGGNSDWQFFPVEFVDSWVPAINELYTINNTNSGRGALIYNPDASTKYVWSSGKSGTFDATNANSQWVIIPTGTSGQYYLYNVGAGKFAIPSGAANGAGNPWVFSDNAVAMVFETQSNGTKKIKMASNPVSGTNAAYISVSNGQTYPIINYNDAGSEFTITKVTGDASTAASTAVAKLVKNQTALTGAVTADDGWYVISIKTTSNPTATASPGRYIYPGTTNQANYPLTFTGGVDVQPAITDATFFTRFVKNGSDYNWQMTDGRYLINRSNVFPTTSNEPAAVNPGYNNGNYIYASGRYADPYVSNGNFFIGETASYRTTWNIYPIDLAAAGLVAWQMVCDAAPESATITCSRSDVKGLTAVYKNGFFFLPTGVTPESTDFNLDRATNVTVDASAHTVTFAYDPDLAIVEGSVTVEQGWQTAGRDSEVMLLKVTVQPFKAAINTTLTVKLKDGSEANISTLKLYEANNNSPEIYSTGDGAPTKTEVATASISGSTATFSIGSLSAGTHYYWIGATVSSSATLGAVLDAAVTGIIYTCNENVTNLDLTSVGDPADRGAMVFNVRSYPFLPRDNGSHVYRIPAMVVADDGSIVAAVDKRYGSHTDIGNSHVIDIVVRRSTDGGKTWGTPVVVAKGDNSNDATCGYGDPSLTKGKDGKLYLLFAAGNTGYFYGLNRICMVTSTDDGLTWSSIQTIAPASDSSAGITFTDHASLYDYFVTSGKGLYTHDGVLMFLLDAQTASGSSEQNYVLYSTDDGATWHIDATLVCNGGNEAKLEQANDGSLIASIRTNGNRCYNLGIYTKNNDGTCSFTWSKTSPIGQWTEIKTKAGNNQDILYYQRETETGKTDVIFHSMTTENHADLKLYYSTDGGSNWTEFLNVQTKGTRYVTMDKSSAGSLYLLFEDQSLNAAGGSSDYNHYPINFLEITREQLLQYIPDLDKSALEKEVKIVNGLSGETTYGSWSGLTWTSNDASGVAGLTMTLSDGSYNRFSNFNSRYNLAYHPTAANTNSTLTLTAPEGYVITGYSVQTGVYKGTTYTLTASDGTSVTPANLESTYTPLEVSGLSAASTTITITTTDASKWLSLANFTVDLIPLTTYTRSVTVDRWGTICVPGAVAAADISGADIYTVVGKVLGTNGRPTSIKLAEVTDMEAGKPYLFLATDAQLSLTFLGSTAVTMPRPNNGLVGSFKRIDVATGNYILTDNTIKICGTGCTIGANRAYINMSDVPVYSGLPGVKSITIFDDTTTDIDAMDNGQLTIDNGQIYNLAGQRLDNSQLRKGVYIVNGKKVLVK